MLPKHLFSVQHHLRMPRHGHDMPTFVGSEPGQCCTHFSERQPIEFRAGHHETALYSTKHCVPLQAGGMFTSKCDVFGMQIWCSISSGSTHTSRKKLVSTGQPTDVDPATRGFKSASGLLRCPSSYDQSRSTHPPPKPHRVGPLLRWSLLQG